MPAPSVQALTFLFLLALGFALAFGYPSTHDPDIWWHLKSGEWILARGTVPWVDPFGYNTSGSRWLAYSWLAEVLFHRVDQTDPALGLRYVQGAIAAATVGVLYLHARATSRSPRLALTLCALFLIPTFPWLARPQVFSFLLTAVAMFLLWWGQHRDRRAWWGLPPLITLWANLHIYFLLGLGLVWLLLAWPWLGWLLRRRAGGARPPLLGILVALLAALAPLLNPYGWALYDEAFHLALHGASDWPAEVISELASPNFHDWPRKVFFGWIALAFLALLVPGRRPSALVVLLFLGLLFRSLQHVRDNPYFIIVVLPFVAEQLAAIKQPSWQRFLSGEAGFWSALSRRRAVLHWFLALGAVAAFAALPVKLWLQKAELATHRTEGYPAAAVAYVRDNRPAGPLYNSFNWGGYLIYALAPDYKVYIDGRTQLYSKDVWMAHDVVRSGKEGWAQGLAATGARLVLWPRSEPLASLLRRTPDWALVYEDDTAAVFVKRGER